MPNDGGLIAVLEQWLADTLAALQHEGSLVFKTAEVWKHQIAASAGGYEKADGFAPFAFVGYLSGESAREGDNDLREVLEFGILVGCKSKYPGVARFGDADDLGTSKIRDLVIAAFDQKRPDDEEIECDEFYYTGDNEIFDSPVRHMIQMNFEVSKITVT